MSRAKYILRTVMVNVIQLPVIIWFFAPYNSIGIEQYLPKKSFLTWSLAIIIIIATGAWFKSAVPPPPSPSGGLSRRALIVLDGAAFLIAVTALARFTVPLISSSLPIFGRRLQPQEYMAWAGLLSMTTILLRILPLFATNILRTSNEVLASDPRKPVIYFRSFEKELSKTGFRGILLPYLHKMRAQKGVYAFSTTPGNTFYGGRMYMRSILGTSRSRFDEQMVFAHALSAVGPYVALGRPTENFRDMDLGAAKKYVSNDEWQHAVIDWLRNCAAVVIEAADSASLGWEIEQVARLMLPTKVLVICPHTEDEYQTFVRTHERRFPRRFPRMKPQSRLLIFNNNWFPKELENRNLNVTETLQPFFEQLRTGIAG